MANYLQSDESLLEKLNRFDKQYRSRGVGSEKWRKEARECYDMVAGGGAQWDSVGKAAMEEIEANPIELNGIDPMISAISGAEISNRQTVKYSPRQPGAAQVNEILTGAVDFQRDECDANDEESHAFRDALTCGLGVTETRMDYDENPQGDTRVDRCDPLEFAVDPTSLKANFTNAKHLCRERVYAIEDARVEFPDLYMMAGFSSGDDNSPHKHNPGEAYTGADGTALPPGYCRIKEYQWRELESFTMMVDPSNGQVMHLGPEEEKKLKSAGIDPLEFGGVRMKRTLWFRAFRAGDACFKEKLPDEEFTYKFITGKLDRNKAVPYGVVRAMIDPQRWRNKFLAQIDWIIGSNAKGGVMLEHDAVEDVREFEEKWSQGNSIVEVNPGAIAQGKIQNKPVPPYPQGLDRLLQIVTASLSEVTGVNKEMLGMADQQQAGVLEYQRKQAAFGVLAVFFDSLRRYRRQQGRLHLKLISKYLSDGRLIRIVNNQGLTQYVPLVRQQDTLTYDVIVDDAPQGPNQQERVWQMLQGLPAIMKALQGMPPEMIFAILEWSPLPASLVSKLRELYQQNAQSMQAQQQVQQQLYLANAQAGIAKTQSEAAKNNAQAQGAMFDAQMGPMRMQQEQQGMQLDAATQQLDHQQAAWKAQGEQQRIVHEQQQMAFDAQSEQRKAALDLMKLSQPKQQNVYPFERRG